MPAGRPPIYETEDAIHDKIEEYFVYIKGELKQAASVTAEGVEVEEVWERYPEHPSITGLALYLGFASRQSFYDYEKESEFSYTVKRARLKVEAYYEQGLHKQSPTGSIFALKNFGWKDKQDIEHSGIGIGFLSIDPLADDQTDNGTTKDSATKEA